MFGGKKKEKKDENNIKKNSKKITKPLKIRIMSFKANHDRQTDRQNKVQAKCAYVIRAFIANLPDFNTSQENFHIALRTD